MSLITLQGCQWIMKTVNQALPANRERIDLKQATAYAEDAEYQMSLGNPPCFEMKSWDTASRHTQEFEVPQRYVDWEKTMSNVTDEVFEKLLYVERGIRTRINDEYRELQKRADALLASQDDLQSEMRAIHWRHQEGLVEGLELALSIMKERA